MFYYLAPSLTYNILLIIAAIVPAVFLMVKVYRSDRLESEDPRFLRALAVAGVLSSLLAMVEEGVFSAVLKAILPDTSVLFNVILYFIIVAGAEESSKFIFLRRKTWKSPEFNCRYDAVVYAVFVSLGFALWENISYVLMYGLGAALVRAVTAIPGHACFGVFMGIFYSFAKAGEYSGDGAKERKYTALSILVPMLLHGTYDFIATYNSSVGSVFFIIFVAAMFFVSYRMLGKASKSDSYYV